MQKIGRTSNQKIESTAEILDGLGIVAPWQESRGRKPRYFFHTMQPGEVKRFPATLKKSRAIQTAIKNAANRQHIKIMTQNKGTFILVKRIK